MTMSRFQHLLAIAAFLGTAAAAGVETKVNTAGFYLDDNGCLKKALILAIAGVGGLLFGCCFCGFFQAWNKRDKKEAKKRLRAKRESQLPYGSSAGEIAVNMSSSTPTSSSAAQRRYLPPDPIKGLSDEARTLSQI